MNAFPTAAELIFFIMVGADFLILLFCMAENSFKEAPKSVLSPTFSWGMVAAFYLVPQIVVAALAAIFLGAIGVRNGLLESLMLTMLFLAPATLFGGLIGRYYLLPRANYAYRNHIHFALNAGWVAVLGGLVVVAIISILMIIGGSGGFFAMAVLGTAGVFFVAPPIGFIAGLITAMMGFETLPVRAPTPPAP